MNRTQIMTWAGPLPPELFDALNPDGGVETMTFAGPVAPAEEEPSVLVAVSTSETIMWAGPLPPGRWEPSRRKPRFSAIGHARRAVAKA